MVVRGDIYIYIYISSVNREDGSTDRGVVRIYQLMAARDSGDDTGIPVSEELLLSLVLPHQESPHCIHDQSHGSLHLLPTCCDQHSEYSTVAADHSASDRRLGREQSHFFTVLVVAVTMHR